MSPVTSARPVALVAGLALVAGGSLIATSPAFAAGPDVWYVASTGSDSGAGTSGDPFLTIQHAIGAAADGDTIEVGAGTFAGFTVNKEVYVEGVNAGSAGEDWAGSATSTVVTTTSVASAVSTVSGFEFELALQLFPGSEGSTVTDNVFDSSDHQIWLNSLDGSATTTIEFNTFLQFQPSGQVDAILNSSASGIDIEHNAFYGDGNNDNSVAVNLIGGGIDDITVAENTSHQLANFVVANGNAAIGVSDLTIDANWVYDSVATTVYIGDSVDGVAVTGNLFVDGASSGVKVTSYGGPPVYGGAGPDITISGNTFLGNLRGILVETDALAADLDAHGNIFYGNGTAVVNQGARVLDVSHSWWSAEAGPAVSGKDSISNTGSGSVTTAPVAAYATAFAGATSATSGLTTTLHLGASWAYTDFVIGGLGLPGTFDLVTTDASGDATFTWPADTASGARKIAVYKDSPAGPAYVGVTIPAASYTASPVPGISGHTTVGAKLTVITRTWSPAATLSFQWLADGVAIPSATSSTLMLAPAQAGKKITVTVTATRSGQPPLSKTSAATAAVALGTLSAPVPTVAGSRTIGATLTATPGTWGPVAVTLGYRWLRDGVVIAGATAPTYTQVTADKNHVIQVLVTGTAAGYTAKSAKSVTAAKTGAKLVSSPTGVTVSPNPSVGVAMSITTTGTWQTGATILYQWRANGVAIPGATKATYVPLPADIGKTISVTVYGAKSGFTTARLGSPASAAVVKGTFTTTPVPVITAAKVGYPAAVTLGTWGPKPTSYTYQWAVDGTDIVGATKATYAPSGAQLNGVLTVKVTAVRTGFTSFTVASAGKVIATGAFSTTVKPKITGTARVGRTLTATTPTWTPAATGLGYQWYLDGVAITGAVDDIYTVSTEDLGGRLTVKVTGTRLGFSTQTETSNPTAVVTP